MPFLSILILAFIPTFGMNIGGTATIITHLGSDFVFILSMVQIAVRPLLVSQLEPSGYNNRIVPLEPR